MSTDPDWDVNNTNVYPKVQKFHINVGDVIVHKDYTRLANQVRP